MNKPFTNWMKLRLLPKSESFKETATTEAGEGKDFRRLDVAVEDPVPVQVRQPSRRALQEPEERVEGDPQPRVDQVLPAVARRVLKCETEVARGHPRAVEMDDLHVLELFEYRNLILKLFHRRVARPKLLHLL